MEKVFLRKRYLNSDLKNEPGGSGEQGNIPGSGHCPGKALRWVGRMYASEEQSEVCVAGTQCVGEDAKKARLEGEQGTGVEPCGDTIRMLLFKPKNIRSH